MNRRCVAPKVMAMSGADTKLECILYIAVSLDGYIADARGGVDWLHPFSDALDGFDAFLAGVDCLIMGHTTYKQVAAMGKWPYGEKPVIVIGGSETKKVHRRVKFVLPSQQALLEAMPSVYASRVWLVGGASTAAFAAESGLITRIDLYTIPIFLGDGLRLFSKPFAALTLTTIDTQQYASGVVRTSYMVKR